MLGYFTRTRCKVETACNKKEKPVKFNINHTFTKKVNASLEISLTYKPVPGFREKFDCVLQFSNVHSADTPNDEDSAQKDTENGEDLDGKSREGNKSGRGWLRSFWGAENSRLVQPLASEVPLLLGYVQMFGFVRLNHQIGADLGFESSLAVYWKNREYTNAYCSAEAEEKVKQILHTELFRDNAGTGDKEGLRKSKFKRSGKFWGAPDLHAKNFDATAHYLLHDLVHPFGTMDMPLSMHSTNTPQLTSHQQDELSTNLSKFITPFYMTAQHLIFLSDTILPSQKRVYKFRIDAPPESLPPSYNNKLTGSVGEAGLASIQYLFVVAVQEEIDGFMKHRAVYFPLEFRPRHYGPDRSWLQHDYLQKPLLDKDWTPENIGEEEPLLSGENGVLKPTPDKSKGVNEKSVEKSIEKSAEEGNGIHNGNHNGDHSSEEKQKPFLKKKTSQEKFLEELDSLIEGSVVALAAKERRKSSVSIVSPGDRGLLLQVPEKPRVSFQIRVNSQSLCVLTMSSATYHVGDDVHFFLNLHPDFRTLARVVGFTAHVEAHELFHVQDERNVVNIYKVTPTIKANTYADALMFPFVGDKTKPPFKIGSCVNLPRFLTQQFQASTFMDLRYFMVFRFVLNDFPELKSYSVDEDAKAFTEYVLAYKLENEGNEFKFSIPLTVLA